MDKPDPQPFKASLLFERFGIWMALLTLVVAIWYRFIPLIVLAVFFLVIAGLITIWKRKALTNVSADMKLDRRRVFAGEHVTLSAALENRKWLPLIWLEWEMVKQEGIVWGKEESEGYTLRLLWLLSYQKASWEVEARVENRGVYHVGRVILRSGDGFRFTEEEKQVDIGIVLYAYPQLLSVTVPPLTPVRQWGLGQNGGFLEDPVLISGIRDYQSGDEWRKINWPASARTGKLQTTIHQPVKPRQLMIVIDVRGFSSGRQQAFEWFLSVIASVAVRYHEQGLHIGYASNALDHEEKPIGFAKPGSGITSFMDELAKMTPVVNPRKPDLGSMLPTDELACPLFLFADCLRKEYGHWLRAHHQFTDNLFCYYVGENEAANDQASQWGRMSARKMDVLVTPAKRKRDAG